MACVSAVVALFLLHRVEIVVPVGVAWVVLVRGAERSKVPMHTDVICSLVMLSTA